jgi:hypothetical protein
MSENKTWAITATGFTFHSFNGDTALCRKNIKAIDDRRRTEAQVDKAVADSPHLFRKCTSCEKKEAEFAARVEASMAPVGEYDQVCEGVTGYGDATDGTITVTEFDTDAEMEDAVNTWIGTQRPAPVVESCNACNWRMSSEGVCMNCRWDNGRSTAVPAPASTAAVSRTLKNAGFMPRHGQKRDGRGGYAASAFEGGRVWVNHRFGPEADHLTDAERDELRAELNDGMAAALTEAGYPVMDRSAGAPVVVSGKGRTVPANVAQTNELNERTIDAAMPTRPDMNAVTEALDSPAVLDALHAEALKEEGCRRGFTSGARVIVEGALMGTVTGVQYAACVTDGHPNYGLIWTEVQVDGTDTLLAYRTRKYLDDLTLQSDIDGLYAEAIEEDLQMARIDRLTAWVRSTH